MLHRHGGHGVGKGGPRGDPRGERAGQASVRRMCPGASGFRLCCCTCCSIVCTRDAGVVAPLSGTWLLDCVTYRIRKENCSMRRRYFISALPAMVAVLIALGAAAP